MSLNEVRLRGGLTRDAELMFSDSTGVPSWRASVAVNGTRYDSETKSQTVTTTYVYLIAWGWLAEQIGELNLKKGEEVYVEGELNQYEREVADGKKESKTQVVVYRVEPTRRYVAKTQSPPRDVPPPMDEPPF